MSSQSTSSHEQPHHDEPKSMTTMTSDHKTEVAEGVDLISQDDYPKGLRLAAIVGSLMLGMFLVSLDIVSWSFCQE